MIPVSKVSGVEVDIIELFTDLVLVQEITTKNIYLVPYYCIEADADISYNDNCEDISNVISLEGWKKWRKRKNHPKNLKSLRK